MVELRKVTAVAIAVIVIASAPAGAPGAGWGLTAGSGGAVATAADVRPAPPGDPAPLGATGNVLPPGSLGQPVGLRPVAGAGTGEPGPDDPTREYVLPQEDVAEPILPGKPAFDRKHHRYFVTSADGAVFRGRLDRDRAELVRPGVLPLDVNGSFAVQVDDENRLYVTDDGQGTIDVYDQDTLRPLAHFATGPTGLALDTAVVTPGGDVYVTDRLRPFLYRIPAAEVDAGSGPVQRIPLAGAVPYTVTPSPTGAFNAAGMVALDDTHLIIARTNTGTLFRVTLGDDRRHASATPIALSGTLRNPDGLALVGGTLYAADILDDQVVGIRLDPDRARGEVVSRTADPTFRAPTGLVGTGDRLLVSNSQLFTVPMVPPYTLSSIRIPLGD